MSENKELNLEEMEQAAGGYAKLKEKKGFIVYRIEKDDYLFKIARDHGCTVEDIMAWNPKIKDRNLIYTGDYLYIRQK